MTDQPPTLAAIAREAVERTFLELTGQPLAPGHAEALVEAAFDAISDASALHLSALTIADANL